MHKVWVVKGAVFVRVKELNDVIAVSFSHAPCNTVVTQEIQDFLRRYEVRLVPIYPHESLIWFKILIRGQELTLHFDALLELCYSV